MGMGEWVGLMAIALSVIGAGWRFSLRITNKQTAFEARQIASDKTLRKVGRISLGTRREVRECRERIDGVERQLRHLSNGHADGGQAVSSPQKIGSS